MGGNEQIWKVKYLCYLLCIQICFYSYPLYYDIISLRSLKITQAFHLLLGFGENQIIFWNFKIWNIVQITEGSDNGDSDNRGPIVFIISTSMGLDTRFSDRMWNLSLEFWLDSKIANLIIDSCYPNKEKYIMWFAISYIVK